MPLNWNQLICDRRYSADQSRSTNSSKRNAIPFRSPFESDYDRIIYSKAFRRLGKKTQVHPLETNAHIHNRLTHSLEVASVGRSFARRITDLLSRHKMLPCRCEATCSGPCFQTADDLAHILMASCLAHDIGNPPFGHAGEYTLREWSQHHRDEIFNGGEVSTGLQQDVFIFEGNAQGFRLAARGDIHGSGHLRLTYSTLAAMVKYPWSSVDDRATEKEKYNFFSTEADIAQSVYETLGLVEEIDGQTSYLRHPLSFLSEAADDICYNVIDIEDAVEMKILKHHDAVDLYCQLLGKSATEKHRTMPISQLRAIVVGGLIDPFWKVFESDFDNIMNGKRADDLKAGLPEEIKDAFGKVKQTYKTIFGTDKKMRIEIGAYKLLGRIFKAMANATQAYAKERDLEKIPFVARRCLQLAWEESWLVDNASQPYSWWLHEILDFISGLTDDEAYVISSAIAGVGKV